MVRGCDVIHVLMLIIDTMYSYVYQTNIVNSIDTGMIRKYEVIIGFDTHLDLYTMHKP